MSTVITSSTDLERCVYCTVLRVMYMWTLPLHTHGHMRFCGDEVLAMGGLWASNVTCPLMHYTLSHRCRYPVSAYMAIGPYGWVDWPRDYCEPCHRPCKIWAVHVCMVGKKQLSTKRIPHASSTVLISMGTDIARQTFCKDIRAFYHAT